MIKKPRHKKKTLVLPIYNKIQQTRQKNWVGLSSTIRPILKLENHSLPMKRNLYWIWQISQRS